MKTTIRNLPAPGLAGLANPQPAALLRIPFIRGEKKNYMKHKTSLLYRWITALFLLALPAVVHAQFTVVTNYNLITITGYTGPGGAVVIPVLIDGYAVVDIGSNAFAYTTSLTSITIPGNVTNVGSYAFAYCTNLTSAYFEGNAPLNDGTAFYGDPDAVVYYKAGTTGWGPTFGGAPTEEGPPPSSGFEFQLSDGSITITGYTGTSGALVIPAQINGYAVTGIGGLAFAYSTNLASITIPASVTNVGGLAFTYCKNLTAAYFEGNAPPDGGTNFYGDPRAIVYYEAGTTGWGPTFGGAPTEEETLASDFRYDVFDGSITILSYNGANGAVVIPAEINGDPVTSIGGGATDLAFNLTTVIIPDTVTNIAASAFQGCIGLTTVTIPGSVLSIGDNAFVDCNSLTNVTINDGVISIGASAFSSCIGLTNVTIPNSVTNIGAFAFNLSGLASVTISGGVTSIGAYAFDDCRSLTSVTLSSNVTSIGQSAFANCSSLASITIPAGVTNIGDGAFSPCASLTSAYFEGNAPPDDGTIFSGDTNAIVYYLSGTTGWGPTFGGAPTEEETPASYFQGDIFDGSITVTGYTGPTGPIVIPSVIDGYTVTGIASIGPNSGFRYVTSVTMPNTVTSIGEYAFSDCQSLTNVIIGDGVTNIELEAFDGCDSLTSVTIPDSVTIIGMDAFATCVRLAGVTIPGDVTTIGAGAFGGCDSLTSVTIPASATNIGIAAFTLCTSLTNISVDAANPAYVSTNGILFDKAFDTLVQYPAGLTNNAYTIPNSVTSIGGYAFAGCTNLTGVSIPNSVTNIGGQAFSFCSGLTNIVIPNGVTSVGGYTFRDSKVTSAYFEGNAPPDDGTAFTYDPGAIVYYLPGTTGWGPTFGGAPTELWNPQAIDFTRAGNQFGFIITGPTNVNVVVYACTNLANPVWMPVSTNTLSSSGVSSFSDPEWTNSPSRYYRFSAP